MMVETHMLKPYKKRVEGTYQLMNKMIVIAEKDRNRIKELRHKATTQHLNWTHYPVQWKVDTTRTSPLNFKGFEAETLTSAVTNLPRLKYDRSSPFTKNVAYKNYFVPYDSVLVPECYILKKGWSKVITLLDVNEITYRPLEQDTTVTVESYRIKDFKTRKSPYEGHYLHFDTKIKAEKKKMMFSKGDIVIPTDQPGIRYILETLEPSAVDSFFNWNFFDTILQQKEGFSPYVFEDQALEMLKENEELKEYFELKKSNDSVFANNWYAQLSWLFKKSENYEPAHMQYPVYRILKK